MLEEVAELEKRAQQYHGLENFGPRNYRENLRQLLRALHDSGKLTSAGQEQTCKEILQFLGNRLQVEDWLKQYPEILQEPVIAPVFAAGLPRSGTTLLLHLFDHDPQLQLLRTWEAMQPCPPPGLVPESVEQRIEDARQSMASVWRETVPGFDALHLIDAEGPDECTQLLSNDFNQAGFFNYLDVPGYFDYLLQKADFIATYAYHKKQLQLLQWQRPSRRWVLKYPNHLLALDAIKQVHQQPRFLLTHRDPVVTLASLCDLTVNFRGSRSDLVDKYTVGRQMLDFVKVHIDRLLAFAGANSEIMLDIDYYALVSQPLDVMQRAYDFLQLDMPATVRAGIERWVRDNPQGKRGRHEYRLEDFGLDRDEVEAAFSDYRQNYSIHYENR